jgi:hypothetical protein
MTAGFQTHISGHFKGRINEEGKGGNMVEVLSVYVWIWNIFYGSHFKKGSWGRGRIIEGMNQTGA